MCSKQVRGCFWIYSSSINFVRLKCSTTKNACWKQVVGYFLVYLSLISNVRLTFYYKKLVLKASESLACFFSLFIINQEVRRLRFFVCLFVFSFFFVFWTWGWKMRQAALTFTTFVDWSTSPGRFLDLYNISQAVLSWMSDEILWTNKTLPITIIELTFTTPKVLKIYFHGLMFLKISK